MLPPKMPDHSASNLRQDIVVHWVLLSHSKQALGYCHRVGKYRCHPSSFEAIICCHATIRFYAEQKHLTTYEYLSNGARPRLAQKSTSDISCLCISNPRVLTFICSSFYSIAFATHAPRRKLFVIS